MNMERWRHNEISESSSGVESGQTLYPNPETSHEYPKWYLSEPDSKRKSNGFLASQANLFHSLWVHPVDAQFVSRSNYRSADFSKPDRMMRITEEFPQYRPRTIKCLERHDVGNIYDAVLRLGAPVYIKGDAEVAWRTFAVTGETDDYTFEHFTLLEEGLSSIQLYHALSNLPADDGMLRNYIVEKAIPIARRPDGRTWESRFIATEDGPDSARNFHGMKVAKDKDWYLNSVARGGSWRDSKQSHEELLSIVQHHMNEKDELQAQVIAEQFFTESAELADRLKTFSDAQLISIAKTLIDPSLFRNPAEYDQIMQACFTSVASCSDITGWWDEQDQRLRPAIIEQQEVAELPKSVSARLTDCVMGRIERKREIFLEALREPPSW